jgi:hypothetical protein
MQRRAAAVYFVLFMVLAGGAYGFMQVGMSSPEVSLDGPTYTNGDTLSVNGTSYTVTTIESSTSGGERTFTGELTWFNESNVATAALENDSTVQYQDEFRVQSTAGRSVTMVNTDNESETVRLFVGEQFSYLAENVTATVSEVSDGTATLAWDRSATLQNGTATTYQGGQYEVRVRNGSDGMSFVLLNQGNGTSEVNGTSFAVDDDYQYTTTVGNTTESVTYNTTVEAIDGSNVSLAWEGTATLETGSTLEFRDGYSVFIANETNVSAVTLTRERNLSSILSADQRVENDLLDRGGTQFVRFREDGRTQPLSEYVGDPDTKTLTIGSDFYYVEESTETNVTAIAPAEATLSWVSPANETIEFGEGGNITLAGQSYFGHFPDNTSIQVLPNSEYYGQYANTLSDIEYYQERQNGVWGIVLISLLAAIVLVAAAYMPTK